MTHAPWNVSVITVMPEMYPGPLGHSLIGDALARNLWALSLINLRDFGIGPHAKIDDSPYGGGAGMVLKPDVVDAAIAAAYTSYKARLTSPFRGEVDALASGGGSLPESQGTPTRPAGDLPPGGGGKLPQLIHFTPRGEVLNQNHFREFAQTDLILLAGRYEAVDERVIEKHRPREISLGDFILTGGDIPAMALIEGCVRLLPGVIGKEASLGEESFGDGAYANLLEYPHYTKPGEWEGRTVPPVLTSGHHGQITKWRLEQAKAITKLKRPDLLK